MMMMNWFLGKQSALSLQSKILLYKQILVPVWSYGIQLWRCAHPSIVETIQRFQNKVLRILVNAPWYIRNSDIHLGIDTVQAITQKAANAYYEKLLLHVNEEALWVSEH